ncbi:MAG: acyl carrier protein [Patescibacteria group bacterium]
MDIKNKLREFLEKETQKEISNDSENLLAANILDSFSMMKLISFIESDLGVKIDMEKLTPENFNSVDKIAEFIK